MIIGLDSFLIQNFLYSIGRQALNFIRVTLVGSFCSKVKILSLVRKVFLVTIISNLLPTGSNLSFFQRLYSVSHLIYLAFSHLVNKAWQALIMSLHTSVQLLFIIALMLFLLFFLVGLHAHLFTFWSVRWWKQYALGIPCPVIEKSIVLIILLLSIITIYSCT